MAFSLSGLAQGFKNSFNAYGNAFKSLFKGDMNGVYDAFAGVGKKNLELAFPKSSPTPTTSTNTTKQNTNSVGISAGTIKGMFGSLADSLGSTTQQIANKVTGAAYRTSALQTAANDESRVMNYNSAEAQKNRDWQTDENEKNRQYNREEAQRQRDYETEMSNTAFQRAVKDMKAAGINPLYAANIGGASTPSGSAASYSGVGSGGQASVGYQDYSSAKNSDARSYVKDLFGDLFGDLITNTTKMDMANLQSQTAKTTAIINGISNVAGSLLRFGRGGSTYNSYGDTYKEYW